MLYYKGDSIRSEMSLKKEGENEYSGMFTDLASRSATMRGPAITRRPPDRSTWSHRRPWPSCSVRKRSPLTCTSGLRRRQRLELKGLKQQFPAEKVYLGGETSRIELPAGSDLRLKGTADKDLNRVVLVPRA